MHGFKNSYLTFSKKSQKNEITRKNYKNLKYWWWGIYRSLTIRKFKKEWKLRKLRHNWLFDGKTDNSRIIRNNFWQQLNSSGKPRKLNSK
jgi:hypothetical protein